MRCRFLHMADVHLGNRQYGLDERADDFAAAFFSAIDMAVAKRVDFVLIAGDLFHKRQPDAQTLNQAFLGLRKLQAAGIPVIAVQGNHELAHYEESLNWLQFLALQGLLVLLHPDLKADPFVPQPYAAHRGSYIDPCPGVRVFGLHYVGAAAGKLIETYAQGLARLAGEGAQDGGQDGQGGEADGAPAIAYRVFVAHSGVLGVLTNDSGSPSRSDWRALDGRVDYIALGHVHKPFDYDDLIFNPGSLETCALDEAAWADRGVLLVDVDTDGAPPHYVRRVPTQRRPIQRLSVKVDEHATAEALLAACRAAIARDGQRHVEGQLRPVVEVTLAGSLAFTHHSLNLDDVRTMAAQELNALHVLVRNMANPLQAGGSDLDEEMSRGEMEEMVFSDLFGADAGYRSQNAAWARGAMEVKRLALQQVPPALVVSQIDATLLEVAGEDPERRAAFTAPAADEVTPAHGANGSEVGAGGDALPSEAGAGAQTSLFDPD